MAAVNSVEITNQEDNNKHNIYGWTQKNKLV